MDLKIAVRDYMGKSNIGSKIYLFLSDIKIACLRGMSDKSYLKLMYYVNTGRKLNIDAPVTFNEKMQWLKLYDRKNIYRQLADKCKVRDFVKSVCGNKLKLVPVIGVWSRPEDIDFSILPVSFVLKCNHNSGKGMCICKNKEKLDYKSVCRNLKKGLREDYFWQGREWQYWNIEKKILAEKYMVDDSGSELKDYKVFVFNGKAVYIEVDYDRFTDHHRNFYDLQWNYVPFTTLYPTNPDYKVMRPDCLDDLIECSELLAGAAGIPPFLRVDFYVINGEVYFGEITFHHGSGIEPFCPAEYDKKLGSLITLE